MAIIRGGLLLYQEEAIGDIDGVNKTFTTSYPFLSETIRVLLNGLELRSPDDYVIIDSSTFQLNYAPIGGSDPDTLVVSYQRV